MMERKRLAGRAVIVTGAGRGLGRTHALALAAQGASVVVNDLGVAVDGAGSSETPADEVVAEIRKAGGIAIASRHDVSDWSSAKELVESAVREFGHLDVLVNNAGILRDRSLANMSEQEWDDVIRVHLKGHAGPTSHAMAYWRSESKAGRRRRGALINTTSITGLFPTFGQANYSAAKAGIVALTRAAALEGGSFGVRANAVSPSANTRLVQGSAIDVPGGDSALAELAPESVSPLVAWLATEDCPASGQVFQVYGRRIAVYQVTGVSSVLKTEDRWTLEKLDEGLAGKLMPPVTAADAIAMLIEESEA